MEDAPKIIMAALWHGNALSAAEISARSELAGHKISAQRVLLLLEEIRVRLETDGMVPFRLCETGGKWSLTPKTPTLEAVANNGRLKSSERLEELDFEVLSVVLFTGGASANRVHTFLQRTPDTSIEKLSRLGWIYAIPKGMGKEWRPSPTLLSRFGYRRYEEIPGYAEFRAYLEGRLKRSQAEDAADRILNSGRRKRFASRSRTQRASLHDPERAADSTPGEESSAPTGQNDHPQTASGARPTNSPTPPQFEV